MIRTEGSQDMKKRLGIIILGVGMLIFAYFYSDIFKNTSVKYKKRPQENENVPKIKHDSTQSFIFRAKTEIIHHVMTLYPVEYIT